MIKFILNDEAISTNLPAGTTLLDFVRHHKNLVGTKIGCREGDCGACTILVGELEADVISYSSLTSCLTPLGNVNGKHVLTIEGLNMTELTPVQQAMVDESGTQCGFCTVGFIMSLSGSCLSMRKQSYEDVVSCVDGNICRCTGYKSIERAAMRIHEGLQKKDLNDPLGWLIENRWIPEYFNEIPSRLQELSAVNPIPGALIVGGGTDLYVQNHYGTEESAIRFFTSDRDMRGVFIEGNNCTIGGAATVSDLLASVELTNKFPRLEKYLRLVSSTPIRNIATIAGNFVNASPIGDMTAFFMALDSSLVLRNTSGQERRIFLRHFYKSYKVMDKHEDEHIQLIQFEIPGSDTVFNFEKLSKRTYLDIASVNSAISMKLAEGRIVEAHVSAGGVAPVPLYLEKTSAFLQGKVAGMELIKNAISIIEDEISPISDVRGTKEYKTLLLKQLFRAHFYELFPEIFREEIYA